MEKKGRGKRFRRDEEEEDEFINIRKNLLSIKEQILASTKLIKAPI